MTIDWTNQRILILAPHPDDETLGCGGLMAKAKELGAEIYVRFLTVGDTRDYSPTGVSTAQERNSEIKRVADFFEWDGWDIVFAGNEYHLRLDQVARVDLANAIERDSPLSIAELRPSIVITTHRTSYNQDHQVAAEALHTATRPSNRSTRHHPRLILAFEEAADQWRYDAAPTPNFLVELEERHINTKIAGMRQYGSQIHDHPHTRSELTLRSLALLRGMQSGTHFAEGFHCLRWLA